MKTLACISTLIGLLGSSAYATGTWNLAADWDANVNHANPNGAWSYGQMVGGAFSTQPWSPVVADNTPGYYGVAGNYAAGAFVYQVTSAWATYGVNPGQVSIESDWGTAAVEWTAPSRGIYDIAVAIGGTTAIEQGPQGQDRGNGNVHASTAELNIGGANQTGSYSSTANVISWDLNGELLSAGETIIAYVPEDYGSGNNQAASFTVTAVPEPRRWSPVR